MISFKKCVGATLTGVIAISVPASVSAAQEAASAPPPPITIVPASTAPFPDATPSAEHFGLVSAMFAQSLNGEIPPSLLNAMRDAMLSDPNVAALESISPGLIAEYVERVQPLLIEHQARIMEEYSPIMAGVFARYFTPDEAKLLADFYNSDLGQRLLETMSQNQSVSAMFESGVDGKPITQDQMNRDISATTESGLAQLSEEDLSEITLFALRNPPMRKLNPCLMELRPVRLKMENEPLSSEVESEAEKIMIEIVERRFKQ